VAVHAGRRPAVPTRTARMRPHPPHPLLRAKLVRPNPQAHVLDRPRLLHGLAEHAERPLTLIVADAGYGKTTLLSQFVAGLRRPVVWYSLMPSDADLVMFGRYLLEGFRRHSPRFGRAFQRALEDLKPRSRAAEMLAGTLASELAALRGPRVLLVLDDFQDVVGQPAVIAFMEAFLRVLPDTVRVVIASRSLPPLGLERMRARGDVFELHSGTLRLTRDELSRLFDEVYRRPLSGAEIQSLEEATVGWPTAVHLVHESLRRSESGTLDEVLHSFRTSNLELHDYLSAEVYARLDEPSRRLVERTAALSRFDDSLASRLAGQHRPQAALEALAQRGLLRTFGAGEHVSYECHELVRRFVRQEIEGRFGLDGWRALEAETADALAARGEVERALRHYLSAGRAEEGARILRELAPSLLRQGRAAALQRFLGELPGALLKEDVTLAVAQAEAQQSLGAWDEAQALFEQVLERCRALPSAAARRPAVNLREIECRALLGLGKLLNLRGRHEQVLGMAERGLALAQALDLEIRARLLQMKAGAHFYLGQYHAAVQVLGQVRELLAGTSEPDLLLPTIHNLALAYFAQGRYREAVQEFRIALAQVRGADSPRAALYLSNLAFVLSELGDLAEARTAAEEGLVAAQSFSNRPQECINQQTLAQVLVQCGDLEGALAAVKRAEELNGELRMEVIAADLLALRGRIFCARGEYRRAVEFLTQAIERVRERPDAPRLPEFQATLAWCELRAGRVRVAHEVLIPLSARADAGEDEYQRMRVHYWLGEALLALDEEREAKEHLGLALRLVRERGYLYFLRVQAREEPAPLLAALAGAIEVNTAAAALVEAGGMAEVPLLEMLEKAPTAVGEAAIAVLGEVGGRLSKAGLARLARPGKALQPAIRTALRHIEARIERGAERPAESGGKASRLRLFGPPQLMVDSEPLPASAWRTQRAFQVLVYLSFHPRGANREELIDSFWPGRQAAAGRRNFHPTLSYIRSVLPAGSVPPILREVELYRLNPAYPLTCDVWEFERALEEARAAKAPDERRATLERAAALASAPLLEGFYAEWAIALQGRYRDRLEKLLLDLGGLCARQAEFELALDCFRRAAELDEYREATRLAVIECLTRLGNRRAALAEYDKLKALLRSQLGVEPLPETEEGVRRLLAGKGAHGWPEPRPQEIGQPDGVQEVTAQTQAVLKRRERQ
jgi:LuxR family maltose regulon positive regulatory protein